MRCSSRTVCVFNDASLFVGKPYSNVPHNSVGVSYEIVMPTYDYQCKSCKHTWEAFQGIKAPAQKKCPECNKNSAQRVIGPGAGIIFKGSGFYITDYRSDSYKKAAAADSTTSSTSDSGKSEGAKSPAASSKPSSSKKPKTE